jgi:hypothetical protein
MGLIIRIVFENLGAVTIQDDFEFDARSHGVHEQFLEKFLTSTAPDVKECDLDEQLLWRLDNVHQGADHKSDYGLGVCLLTGGLGSGGAA